MNSTHTTSSHISTTVICIAVVIACTLASIIISITSANAKTTDNDSFSISINGIQLEDGQGENGNIMIAIYDNASAFNTNGVGVHSLLSLKANASKMKISLADFPKGRFAVSVFHDKNSNGVLDYNDNHIPVEAYAFSQNVGAMAMPTFEQAEFTHTTDTMLHIEMIQPK